MNKTLNICEQFYKTKEISFEDFSYLMELDGEEAELLHAFARELAVKNFGKEIYIRGLIEVSTLPIRRPRELDSARKKS